MPKAFPQDFWNRIVEEVISETTHPLDVAKREGITVQSIDRQLKLRGLKRPPNRHRQRSLNEDYFSIIDSEDKAYWLGFIVADGSIQTTSSSNNRPNRLAFNISASDIELLEGIKASLGSDAEIRTVIPKGTYSENPIARLSINSQKICTGLLQYGVSERKTGSEILPNLPTHLMRHFIRGFFDGDGHVTYNGQAIIIGFSSGASILYSIREYLHQAIGTSNEVSVLDELYGKGSSRLLYGKRSDILTLYSYLYQDATLFLHRKYEHFTVLLSEHARLYHHPNGMPEAVGSTIVIP